MLLRMLLRIQQRIPGYDIVLHMIPVQPVEESPKQHFQLLLIFFLGQHLGRHHPKPAQGIRGVSGSAVYVFHPRRSYRIGKDRRVQLQGDFQADRPASVQTYPVYAGNNDFSYQLE